MLQPDKKTDRLNYSTVLMPPSGYTLERAIGTTYSLDLETLMAVSVVLGLEDDSIIARNQVVLLRSLKKISEKILIFCEDGQIKTPNKDNSLAFLLEKVIIPVALPKGSTREYPSFHPKTWLLEYVNEKGDKCFRFIVLSRNLTFDRSWDVCFCVDGETSQNDTVDVNTTRIVSFYRFLRDNIRRDVPYYDRKKQQLIHIEHALSNVEFALKCKEFSSFEVFPIGIGDKTNNILKDELFTESYHELVVVSPFINNQLIESFLGWDKELTGCKKALFTRNSELEKLSETVFESMHVYTLKNQVVKGETILSYDEDNETNAIFLQDIHAKLYMRRKNSHSKLYIGSMNATHRATHDNVEMLIKLNSYKKHIDYDKLIDDLFCGQYGDDCPFVRNSYVVHEKAKEDNDNTNYLENIIKEFCRLEKKAKVIPAGDKYNVIVELSNTIENVICDIRPLLSQKKSSQNREMVFENLSLSQLTAFYVISVSDGNKSIQRVVIIPTSGIPDDREKAVVSCIFKDDQDFLEYISLVLEDNLSMGNVEIQHNRNSNLNGFLKLSPTVYERMLKAAVKNPERLIEIEYVINMIDNQKIVSEEFRSTFAMFKQVLKI